jgi:hypothetical protein
MAPAAEATADALKNVNDGLRDFAKNLAVRPNGEAKNTGPPPRGPMPVSPARPGYLPRG